METAKLIYVIIAGPDQGYASMPVEACDTLDDAIKIRREKEEQYPAWNFRITIQERAQ